MQNPDKLNDETTYQRCFACGVRNPSGLQMVFQRSGHRILAEFVPQDRHQGFPGLLHGGIITTLLDEALSRTGALRRVWLMTGRLEVRFRRPARIGERLRVWGEIARERPGAIDAVGAVEGEDGTVIADGRGLFLRMPGGVGNEALDRYPDFANYWET